MKRYNVEITAKAKRDMRVLPVAVQDKVILVVQSLAVDPRPPGCKKLVNRDEYRIRVGNYRVCYEVRDREVLVIVVRMKHRRDVYRR